MSEYIMAPGARLEVGPGGKPYESMGACCAACSSSPSGLGGAGGRGGKSLSKPVPPPKKNVQVSASMPPPARSGALAGKLPYLIAGAAVLGFGAVMLMRRR